MMAIDVTTSEASTRMSLYTTALSHLDESGLSSSIANCSEEQIRLNHGSMTTFTQDGTVLGSAAMSLTFEATTDGERSTTLVQSKGLLTLLEESITSDTVSSDKNKFTELNTIEAIDLCSNNTIDLDSEDDETNLPNEKVQSECEEDEELDTVIQDNADLEDNVFWGKVIDVEIELKQRLFGTPTVADTPVKGKSKLNVKQTLKPSGLATNSFSRNSAQVRSVFRTNGRRSSVTSNKLTTTAHTKPQPEGRTGEKSNTEGVPSLAAPMALSKATPIAKTKPGRRESIVARFRPFVGSRRESIARKGIATLPYNATKTPNWKIAPVACSTPLG